jgi:predicted outer membrane protein
MDDEQKGIVKEIKTLVEKLEATIKGDEQVSKSADGDWINNKPVKPPPRN